ncbi:MAG: DUF2975 domain-containing protein [Jejuia sp.]
MKQLFKYLSFFIGFIVFSLFLGAISEGFKLINSVFQFLNGSVHFENNSPVFRLFLESTTVYPNIFLEVIFRVIRLSTMTYLLLKFLSFKSIIPDLKNKVFFTSKNYKASKQLGKAIIIFSILISLVNITNSTTKSNQGDMLTSMAVAIGESIGSKLFLILMGLLLIIIAKLINEALELKQENDLTI